MVADVAVAAGVEVGCSPAALGVVARVGASSSWELERAASVCAVALSACSSSFVPSWAWDLAPSVVALARRWAELDAWAGRVGSAVAAADAVGLPGGAAGPPLPWVRDAALAQAGVAGRPSWVDVLSDAEAAARVLSASRRLRVVAPFVRGAERVRLRESFAPLVARVQARWPAARLTSPVACAVDREPPGLQAALRQLRFPGEGRRFRTTSLVRAFATGLASGAPEPGDEYDAVGPTLSRTLGSVLSGVFVYGDLRDAGEEAAKDNWPGALFAAAALIPIAGDAAKSGKALEALAARADELQDAAKAAEELHAWRSTPLDLALHDSWAPRAHAWSKHLGLSDLDLAARLEREPGIPAASSLADGLRGAKSVEAVLNANELKIDEWLRSGKGRLPISHRFRDPVGRLIVRGDEPRDGRTLMLLLDRSPLAPEGWYIHTMTVSP